MTIVYVVEKDTRIFIKSIRVLDNPIYSGDFSNDI